MWTAKGLLQGEKNTGGKGREESFKVKRHPTGVIGSAEPGVKDNSQFFGATLFTDIVR